MALHIQDIEHHRPTVEAQYFPKVRGRGTLASRVGAEFEMNQKQKENMETLTPEEVELGPVRGDAIVVFPGSDSPEYDPRFTEQEYIQQVMAYYSGRGPEPLVPLSYIKQPDEVTHNPRNMDMDGSVLLMDNQTTPEMSQKEEIRSFINTIPNGKLRKKVYAASMEPEFDHILKDYGDYIIAQVKSGPGLVEALLSTSMFVLEANNRTISRDWYGRFFCFP